METLGPLVRMTRESKGIRAADLAYQIGKDPSYLSRLERDLLKDMPTPEVISALSSVLGLPEVRLLKALGFFASEPNDTAYTDERLQLIADHWDSFTPVEQRLFVVVLNENRARRGLPALDDPGQSVAQTTPSVAAMG